MTDRPFDPSSPQETRPLIAGSFDASPKSAQSSDREGITCQRLPSGGVRITGEGLNIALASDTTRLAVHPDSITICLGKPRLSGAPSADAITVLDSALRARRTTDECYVPNGHFAVIHIDLTTRSALLATDRFATTPICYAVEGDRIFFSDRADSVHASGADPDIDLQAIYDFVYFHVIPSPRTLFRNVRRLEPATRLRFSKGSLETARTWTPDYSTQGTFRFADAAPRLLQLVHRSIAGEIEGASSPGAYLSGGTDSSTVLGCLGNVTGSPARAFSIGFEAEGYDEMAYARTAARHFGARHYVHYVTPNDVASSFEHIASSYDQPFGNSSALPAFFCAKLAKSEGVDRLLAGDGGDELFGGNTRYAKQKVFSWYFQLPSVVRTRLLEPLLARETLTRNLAPIRKLSSYVQQARLPMPERMETYNLLDRFGAASVFEAAFLERVDRSRPLALQRRVYEECSAPSLVDRMLRYDWRFTLADNDLPKVSVTALMAGLAVGFPLLSDDLVDLSVQVPPGMKLRGLRLRHFYKQALRDFLPIEIIRKKKHGFGLPFGLWLASSGLLRDQAHSSLSSLASRSIVRQDFVDNLLSERLMQHPGYFGEMVWVLSALEHWLAAKAPNFRLS